MPNHVVQSPAWANLREKQGNKVVWINDQLMLIKPAPKPFKPLGIMSQVQASQLNLAELKKRAQELGLSHVQIDPNEEEANFKFSQQDLQKYKLLPAESLLLRHTLLIDLTKSDEELLTEMNKNWRYNCKYAFKQGLEVEFRSDDEAVEDFISTFYKTVEAKGFMGRSPEYYRQVWQAMRQNNNAIIVLGKLQNRVVVARMLFLYEDVIYTAYTGTSRDSETSKSKAAYGVMWEIMRWGKANGFKEINMWGIEPHASKNHPHFGFTQFKIGFGGRVVTLAPAFDLVVDLGAYRAFQLANFARIAFVRLKNLLFK